MSKKLIGCAATLAFSAALVAPMATSAATLTAPQINAIISLLQSFGADSATVAHVQAALSGSSVSVLITPPSPVVSSTSCVNLSYNLDLGVTDSTTAGQVTTLQQFLGITVTGRFGSTTVQAVKNWQSDNGIITSGTATTTGYGRVGPKTRAAMRCGGGDTQSQPYNQPNPTQPNNQPNPSAPTAVISASSAQTTVGQAFSISWNSTNAASCNIVEAVPGVGMANAAWCTAGKEHCGTSGIQQTASPISGQHVYTLTCTGPGGSANSAVAHVIGS